MDAGGYDCESAVRRDNCQYASRETSCGQDCYFLRRMTGKKKYRAALVCSFAFQGRKNLSEVVQIQATEHINPQSPGFAYKHINYNKRNQPRMEEG